MSKYAGQCMFGLCILVMLFGAGYATAEVSSCGDDAQWSGAERFTIDPAEHEALQSAITTYTLVYAADFEADTDGWVYATVEPTEAHSQYWRDASRTLDNHALGLSDPHDLTNFYAMWHNDPGGSDVPPGLEWQDNSVWRAVFGLSKSGTAPNSPVVRMRFSTKHQKFHSYVQIYPTDWIQIPNHQTPAQTLDVSVIMDPPSSISAEDGFVLAFDIVDFVNDDPRGGQAGTAWLEEIDVYRYNKAEVDSIFTIPVQSYTATQLRYEWFTQDTPAPGYQLPTYSISSGGVHITTSLGQSRHFGSWTCYDFAQADFTTGSLHRVEFRVSADSPHAPDMRLRTHSYDLSRPFIYASYVHLVPGAGEGQAMPTEATDVYCYFWPPGMPTLPTEIALAFDGIDIEYPFAGLVGGTITLREVMIERTDGGYLP